MEFCANLYDSIIFTCLIGRWGQKKTENLEKWKAGIITVILLMLNIEMAGRLQVHFVIPVFGDFLIIFLTGRYLFRLSGQESLTVFVLFYLVNFISVALAALMIEMIGGVGFDGWNDCESEARILYLITAKILLTLGIAALEFLRKKIIPLNRKLFLWVYIMLPSAVFAVCLYLIQCLLAQSVLDSESVTVVYLLILMLLFTIIILAVFVACAEVVKKENRQLQAMLRRERDSFKRLIAYERKAAKFKHDLKNKMLGIEYLLKAGKVGTGISRLEEMVKDYYSLEYDFSSNQYIWNIMIESKTAEEADRSLQLIQKIDLESLGKIDEVDFCIVLGNLLDNAFEAVKHAEDKMIQIVLTREKGFVYLEIDNTYRSEGNGRTERNMDRYVEHGFGLANIQEIVKKYNGRFEVEKKDQIFKVRVLLPCL